MHDSLTNFTIGPYGYGPFSFKVTFEDYDENDDVHYDLVIVLHAKTPYFGWKEIGRQRFLTDGDLIPEQEAAARHVSDDDNRSYNRNA